MLHFNLKALHGRLLRAIRTSLATEVKDNTLAEKKGVKRRLELDRFAQDVESTFS